ncbi:MAG: hypothetical protein R2736_09515 [Solirubrobacterales bacterium]
MTASLLYGVGVPAGSITADAVGASCARLHDAMAPWRAGRQYLGFVERHTSAAEAFAADTYACLVGHLATASTCNGASSSPDIS